MTLRMHFPEFAGLSLSAVMLTFLLLAMPCSAAAQDVAAAQDLAARMKQAMASHPRLFFPDEAAPQVKAKIDGDALLSAVYGHLTSAADALMNQKPVKREKVGKRLLGVSRSCLQRVSYLAFAYRMTKEKTYLERAKKEMLAAAAFEDWNPSHFLDVSEMTAALALGYDWLFNDLNAETRTLIRDAIIKKGLETSLKGGGWVKGTNNWNQVCHGGLVLGALAVMEDCTALSEQIVARAIENVPRAMQEYEPDGVYPEGPSYWKYGTTYNVLMIAALESVLGSDFGLASANGFKKTPEFYLQASGPTGFFFNFSDCGVRGGIAPAMHWFAQRLQKPGLLWQEKKELQLFAAETPDAKGDGDRMLAFLLVWAQPIGKVDAPETLCWKGDGRTPVAILRTGWQDDATYVGLKGGSPSSNHAHMDTGSFVLDMKGVRWAVDLGSQGYNSLESRGIDLWNKKQESERWTVFRLNNFSHNTLVVDGKLQQVAGKGTITRFSDAPANPYAIVNMSSVYEGQLALALRGVRLMGQSVLIQDEIKTLDHDTSVRWAMATCAEVILESADTATLRHAGQSVSLRVLAPANVKLTLYDIKNPPHDYDAKNMNTYMVGFETSLPATSSNRWAILIEPAAPLSTRPDICAMEDW
ncbi:MAG TPA: heparinase II/III family protein [Candidatus Hydrogenedentes bacterium]|nr:heparinase II/III family protein [Candidatus Hydrogenedentota bacterium]